MTIEQKRFTLLRAWLEKSRNFPHGNEGEVEFAYAEARRTFLDERALRRLERQFIAASRASRLAIEHV